MGALSSEDAKTIVFGVLVALFIVFIAVVLSLSQPMDMNDSYVTPEVAYANIRPGDILTVSYNSIRGKLVKIFTGSMWTHSGLVVETDGHLFVVEVANYKNDVSGVVIKPLEDWFDWNSSRLLGWRPYCGRRFPLEKVLRTVQYDAERDIKPDMNVVNWLKTLVKRKYSDLHYGDRSKYYCSEYITHLLQESGVVRKEYHPDGYKPWELLYGDMPFSTGHNYGSYYLIGNSTSA